MDTRKNRRYGKIIPGKHSTIVGGLSKFLKILEPWPEITAIHLGPFQNKGSGGRKAKKLRTNDSNKTGRQDAKASKRAKAGGNFSFKATRPAMIGSRITGIRCHASDGTCTQLVVLCGNDLEALKLRLKAEGYGANW